MAENTTTNRFKKNRRHFSYELCCFFQIAVSHQDGSQLSPSRLINSDIKVQVGYILATGEQRTVDPRTVPLLKVNDGVWQIKIDLRSQLGTSKKLRQIASKSQSEIEQVHVFLFSYQVCTT